MRILLLFQVAKSGPNQGYFVDPDVLDRVPNLLLILSGIYASMGMLSVYLIRQPADDWVEKKIKLGEQKASKAIRMTATTTAATTTTTATAATATASKARHAVRATAAASKTMMMNLKNFFRTLRKESLCRSFLRWKKKNRESPVRNPIRLSAFN